MKWTNVKSFTSSFFTMLRAKNYYNQPTFYGVINTFLRHDLDHFCAYWARCRPPPTIVWYRSGSALSTGQHTGSRYKWSVGNHTLQIDSLTLDDAGRYQCNARNSQGYSTFSVDLHVYGRIRPYCAAYVTISSGCHRMSNCLTASAEKCSDIYDEILRNTLQLLVRLTYRMVHNRKSTPRSFLRSFFG